jgi:hypothetical protein
VEVNMRIRNMQAYDRGIWDWEILRGCFGDTKICPTDIDGCVERKCKFLYLETKQPGKDVPLGQRITLEQLAKRGDTVLIVHGEQGNTEHITKMTPFGIQNYEDASNDTLRDMVTQWFRWADGQEDMPHPFQLARILRERMGADYCDVMVAEWAKMGG